MKKASIIILFVLICSWGARAQSETLLPLFNDVFQSSYLNPALMPDHRLSLGLPGISSISFQMIHNGFIPNRFISNKNGRQVLHTDQMLAHLAHQNMLHLGADLDIFHLRIKVDQWNYWFASRQKHSMSLFYPKDFVSLLLRGNADMVGQRFDFTPFGVEANLYREFTFGASRVWGPWVFGGRFSVLHGLSNLSLEPGRMHIDVLNNDYEHAVATDFTLYSAGVPFDDDVDSEWIGDFLLRFRNPGFALSLGTVFKFDERTTFSIAINDLGFISWNDNTKHYRIRGEAVYNGIDIFANSSSDNDNDDTNGFMDDFLDNFTDEELEGGYRRWLPPKIYLSANYRLAARTHAGFQFYSTVNRKHYPAVSLNLTQGVGRTWTVATNVAFNQRSFANFGLGLIFKPGPLQFYVITDNYYAPLIDPLSLTNFNLRFGVNMVFGKLTEQQGLPYR